MNVSKEQALKTIKLSLVETQFRIRRDLDLASMKRNKSLHSKASIQLEENQAVLDLMNYELSKITDTRNIA